MKPCAHHGVTSCAVCKCLPHQTTDCTDPVCNQIKATSLQTNSSQNEGSSSPSISTRSRSRSRSDSKKRTGSNNDDFVNYLKQQNAQLLAQVTELTAQVKTLTEQLSNPKGVEHPVMNSPKRKLAKNAETLRKAQTATSNRFANLSAADDDDNDDDDVFVQPDPEVQAILKKARKKTTPSKTSAKPVKSVDKAKRKLDLDQPAISSQAADTAMDTTPAQEKDDPPNTETSNKEGKKPKSFKPPPIKVINARNVQVLRNIINSIVPPVEPDNWFIKALPVNILSINTKNDDTYRAVINMINEKNFEYYTYENKNTRPLRVVAHGLHHSLKTTEIMQDLQSKNFNILSVDVMLKKERKQEKEGDKVVISTLTTPLDSFFLTFGGESKVEDVFKINKICNLQVQVKPDVKDPTLVPMCKRCQGYRHTARHCRKTPRCVKCGLPHFTNLCPRGKLIEDPTCANCGERHPASYRGCIVAKQEAEDRRKELKKKLQDRKKGPNLFDGEKAKLRPSVSFAAAAGNRKQASRNVVDNANLNVGNSNKINETASTRVYHPPRAQPQVETRSLLELERSVDLILSKLDSISTIADRLSKLENFVGALSFPELPKAKRNNRSHGIHKK